MNNLNLTDYELPSNAYLGFDAQSIKELMIQRLQKGGVYTDYEYEGSNFSAVLDVMAYTYHLLIFYLNKMGTESTFTQTQLYENMNRIIKLINYKPIGYQTPCISFDVSAAETAIATSGITPTSDQFEANALYYIPRFAFINVNGIVYSLMHDVSFSISNKDKIDANGNHILSEFGDKNILFQGEVIEHVLTRAADGVAFESLTLVPANNSLKEQTVYVDYSNISIYVYNIRTGWQEWTETPSLYLENNSSLKYEKRLNEGGYYEFKFGNNVHGKQLEAGDVVVVYYLKSAGGSGEIGINQLDGNKLNYYHTELYDSIYTSLQPKYTTLCSANLIKQLNFTNKTPSTKFTQPETVDEIRTNTGKVFKSNQQLVTVDHIQTYIERNFNNIISSAYVVNNKQYLYDIIPYFYTLGLDSINKDSRIAFNQLKFATSCNFNNIYVYMVPKFNPVLDDNSFTYVDSNLKQYIVSKMENVKPATAEIIPMDPIYIAVGFGVQTVDDTLFTDEYSTQTPDDIINSTKIVLTRYSNAHNKPSLIKTQACEIIKNMFAETKLGYTVSTIDLNNALLSIDGVKSIHTERNGVKVNGVSIMIWNPVHYNKDIYITTNTAIFDKFKYPFLYNSVKIEDYIDVQIG